MYLILNSIQQVARHNGTECHCLYNKHSPEGGMPHIARESVNLRRGTVGKGGIQHAKVFLEMLQEGIRNDSKGFYFIGTQRHRDTEVIF